MIKKIVILMFCGIWLLSSCSQSEDSSNILTVGMECNSAPFNWLQSEEINGSIFVENSNGYCAGYDVKVAQDLAQSLEKELVIKAITWEGLIPALNSSDIDIIIAGMSYTSERAKQVNFSEPYYYSDYVMLVKKDSAFVNATSLTDFEGSKLVGQMGTNYDVIIDQVKDVNPLPALSSIPLIVAAINSNSADGSPIEKPIGQSIVKTNPDLIMIEFEENKGFVQSEEITTAVSMAINKDNNELLGSIDEYLSQLTQAQRDTWMSEALQESSE